MSSNDPKINNEVRTAEGKVAATLPKVKKETLRNNNKLAEAIRQYPGILGGNPIKEG